MSLTLVFLSQIKIYLLKIWRFENGSLQASAVADISANLMNSDNLYDLENQEKTMLNTSVKVGNEEQSPAYRPSQKVHIQLCEVVRRQSNQTFVLSTCFEPHRLPINGSRSFDMLCLESCRYCSSFRITRRTSEKFIHQHLRHLERRYSIYLLIRICKI